ncbi:MAG: DUF1730 domain-containing protein [Ruminococcaceae bacterium]|nr:DUF1730 domain-containing protein [Oscillospiraceae bacterium]
MRKTPTDIKEQLKAYAKELKISDIGVCKARVYDELCDALPKYDTPFVPSYDKRISPFAFVKNARSVIMCVFNYYTGEKNDANLSRYAWGLDYHSVVKNKLSKLCKLLKKDTGDFEHYIFCDNSPMCDKHLAYLSGLGFIGENHLLIHPKYGSYVFIGGIITDLDIEEDVPLDTKCDGCKKCKESCPGRVFDELFDARKCASYIMQKKGTLSADEQKIVANSKKVWGCDICSQVCPHNAHSVITDIEEFFVKSYNVEERFIKDDVSFKEAYKNRAFFWRGRETIKRNTDIINTHNK